jgi:hypothetical protein
LRLVRQLLERIVIPEFDLDATVQRPSLLGVVGGNRLCDTATFAFYCRGRQSQCFLYGQCNAVGHCFRQRQVVSVYALFPLAQRCIVGVAQKPDRHSVLAPQVVERPPDLRCKSFGNRNGLFFVLQWRDEVPDACAGCLAFPESQLADGLHPADLDALDVIGWIRFERPFPECLVAGHMSFARFARVGRADLPPDRGSGQHQESDNQR